MYFTIDPGINRVELNERSRAICDRLDQSTRLSANLSTPVKSDGLDRLHWLVRLTFYTPHIHKMDLNARVSRKCSVIKVRKVDFVTLNRLSRLLRRTIG